MKTDFIYKNENEIAPGAPEPKSTPEPGNFWDQVNKVLGTIGETADQVSEGVESVDRAVNPKNYQPKKAEVVRSEQGGEIYKVIAWVAGGALVVFAVIKLASK